MEGGTKKDPEKYYSNGPLQLSAKLHPKKIMYKILFKIHSMATETIII